MRIFISEQDLDLLHRIARGQRFDKIAAELGVGVSTVKQRIKPMLDVFGAKTLPNLIAICLLSGIVDTPELGTRNEVIIREYRRRGGQKMQSYNLRAVRDCP